MEIKSETKCQCNCGCEDPATVADETIEVCAACADYVCDENGTPVCSRCDEYDAIAGS